MTVQFCQHRRPGAFTDVTCSPIHIRLEVSTLPSALSLQSVEVDTPTFQVSQFLSVARQDGWLGAEAAALPQGYVLCRQVKSRIADEGTARVDGGRAK
jgi:hypothetical protein